MSSRVPPPPRARTFEVDFDETPVVHVAPTFGPEHENGDGPECWCDPEVEKVPRSDGSEGLLVVHRAFN